MNMIRLRETIVLVLALTCVQLRGQTITSNVPPTVIEQEADAKWLFSFAAYGYVVSGDDDYFQPTITADHGRLHLEARYNYEDLDTGSIWAGYNFSGGENIEWEITPMLGGVFGDTSGIAPGYKGSLSWWKLELYSEGEYVIDTGDSSDNFFYNWSELTLSPVDWFRFGLVTQHTQAYDTDRDVQRGLLVGFTVRKIDVTTYWFNVDEGDPTMVIALALNF